MVDCLPDTTVEKPPSGKALSKTMGGAGERSTSLLTASTLSATPSRTPGTSNRSSVFSRARSTRGLFTRTKSLRSSSSTSSCSSNANTVAEVSVSTYVRETAVVTVSGEGSFKEVPTASRAVCETLLDVEKIVHAAKFHRAELTSLLQLCDVVTRGILDRYTQSASPEDEGEHLLPELQKLVSSTKKLSFKISSSTRIGLRLPGKASKDIGTVKTSVISFATANNLAVTNFIYVSSYIRNENLR